MNVLKNLRITKITRETSCCSSSHCASEDESYKEVNDDVEVEDDVPVEIIDTQLLISHNVPKDEYNFNYIIFYLMGIASVVPWCFIISAGDVRFIIIYKYI